MSKQVVLTGIRANNDLTIGNYFGAILPIIDMARNQGAHYKINLFVPDLHSFTTPINHSTLQTQIMQTLRMFVAAGMPLDHDDIHIYRQSYIPAHSELTWILDCFTGFGEMSRMTQFKEKSTNVDDDRVSLGLFNYPVLMASDILLYGASYVPVGDDQTQHLEFARNIAERMNNKFNQNLFIIPKPVKEQHTFFGKEQGLRIMDLQSPLKKMSKSEDTGRGVIFLRDSPEEAASKIMKAETDDLALIQHNPVKQPGISNLLEILSMLTNQDLNIVLNEWKGKTSYGTFKRVVADATVAFLTDLQAKLDKVDDSTILGKLESSERSMNTQAIATLYNVQKAVGIR
jgi:tryptophanyl-tRNA synthetase